MKPEPMREPAAIESASPRAPLWMLAVLVGAGIATYLNSFSGVFVFDDVRRIVENESIRDLANFRWRRALVFVSLAVNYQLGGLDVRGYHAFNLAVHLGAGLALFGLVRRSLLLPPLRERYAPRAATLAFVIAMLWLLHPLQTQSVTYVIQRAESMMGMFYVLTLYALLRGATSPRGGPWYGVAILACGLGMSSKAVMVTAPIAAVLYDRAFLAGSFAAAGRRRWPVHLGLAVTWGALLLARVPQSVLGGSGGNRVVGFGAQTLPPLDYALTQPGVLVHYLRLAVWPHPLCLDYWWPAAEGIVAIAVPGLVMVTLALVTLWALWNRPRLGFVGATFFLVLGPTSSVIPIRDVAFEHRMYLPLASVMIAVTLLVDGWLGRIATLAPDRATVVRRSGMTLAGLAIAAAAFGTARRNRDYHSVLTIWRTVVDTRPENPRAHASYGAALIETGDVDGGITHLRKALRLWPGMPALLVNLGFAVAERGETEEAIGLYEAALRTQDGPGVVVGGRRIYARAHLNLAELLVREGRLDEALPHFEASLGEWPGHAPTHHAYGNALLTRREPLSALEHLRDAARLDPRNGATRGDLGRALMQTGATAEALEQLTEAVRLDPASPMIRNNLAGVLMAEGRMDEAIEQVVESLRLDPTYEEGIRNLAAALARKGDIDATVARYRDRVALDTPHALAYVLVGDRARAAGQIDAAAAAYRRALSIEPRLVRAQRRLESLDAPGN